MDPQSKNYKTNKQRSEQQDSTPRDASHKQLLEKVASFSDAEADALVCRLATVLQPMMATKRDAQTPSADARTPRQNHLEVPLAREGGMAAARQPLAGACRNCGKLEHTVYNCPTRICYNCNTLGHI